MKTTTTKPRSILTSAELDLIEQRHQTQQSSRLDLTVLLESHRALLERLRRLECEGRDDG